MRHLPLLLVAALASLLVLGGCGGRGATEDDHGHEHGGTAVTVWTDSTELFFEYPALVAGQPSGPWAVHVTRLTDFSPVTEGALRLRFERRGGGAYGTEAEAPARPGVYTPTPTIPEPGIYRLVVEVDGPQLTDRIVAGAVQVFTSENEAPHPPDPPPGQITFLKEQQWPIAFRVAEAYVREVERSIEARGEVIPAAGAEAVVTAPVDGVVRASRPPGEGEAVRAGQTLAAIQLPGAGGGGATAGDLVAVRARIEHLEREVARAERLYAVEAIPEVRLIEARHDLEVAREALAALRGAGAAGDAVPVTAPISGVVAERTLSPGARVAAGQPLYRIVNPGALRLRLEIPARYAAEGLRAETAVFTVEGGDRAYRASGRVGTAPSIDRATRTLPVHLAVASSDGTLRAGMLADALVFLGGAERGTAVPVAAVQEEDGAPVAYVQTGGESFERRPLRLGPSDGAYVLVLSGVAAGERVVTEGAYAVHLASLNTSEIGHGHTH
jgi:membrane fusion protein, heavy metal efflux system